MFVQKFLAWCQVRWRVRPNKHCPNFGRIISDINTGIEQSRFVGSRNPRILNSQLHSAIGDPSIANQSIGSSADIGDYGSKNGTDTYQENADLYREFFHGYVCGVMLCIACIIYLGKDKGVGSLCL